MNKEKKIEEQINELTTQNAMLRDIVQRRNEELFIKRIELFINLLKNGSLSEEEKRNITELVLNDLGYKEDGTESK